MVTEPVPGTALALRRRMLALILSAVLASNTSTTAIDLNRASIEQLADLPGVGPVLATRIIERRPFRRVRDLLRVKGIGAKKYAQLKDSVEVTLSR